MKGFALTASTTARSDYTAKALDSKIESEHERAQAVHPPSTGMTAPVT